MTLISRNVANPQRTTLAHLTDTDALLLEAGEHGLDLPEATANPRRTTLIDAPQG
ncbi:hypothetical protein JJV70_22105 [Streptomyces sp. JJ66]|uniref:hypothetical protein n=1 Tax=Streptomyces sp. JJ66 TaxID=2803843 RepID=UPI001C575499|nr:hypothetical protein [Streptomyces sp. JJ66]MBW1604739.1 hypothetical protein [Streptomyces sp. JJ66]